MDVGVARARFSVETRPDHLTPAEVITKVKRTKIEFGDDVQSIQEACRIVEAKAKQELEIINEQSENQSLASDETDEPKNRKNFTTARQVQALVYLLDYLKAKDKKEHARKKFLHFLLVKDRGDVYKKFDDRRLLASRPKQGKEDLEYIRGYFDEMELTEIVKMIDNDLGSHFT